MATEAQIQANRLNARKSTGPRTPEGKKKAAQNSLKHGLFAREEVLPDEEAAEFAEYRRKMLDELVPGSPAEETLVARFVDLSWRLKRAAVVQDVALAKLYEKSAAAVEEAQGPEADQVILGRVIAEDFCGAGLLDRLLRYERRIETKLFRCLHEMRHVFDQRQKATQEVRDTTERRREVDREAHPKPAFAPCRPPKAAGGGRNVQNEANRGGRRETPNIKHQVPNPSQIPNPNGRNAVAPRPEPFRIFFPLEIGSCLRFGACNLEFRAPQRPGRPGQTGAAVTVSSAPGCSSRGVTGSRNSQHKAPRK